MRTLLYLLLGLAVLIAAGFMWRYELAWSAAFLLKPSQGFTTAAAGPAPDYADPASWIKRSGGVSDRVSGETSAGAAVFYIHPTTLLRGATWNQPVHAAREDAFLDFLAPQQIAAFKALPVFAPYYRQAAFYSFIDPSSEDGARALDMAAGDVVRAFRAFAEARPGAPIVIAGHSQGAYHALRILNELENEPQLLVRIAVVYAIGYPVPEQALRDASPFAPCASADAVNCVLSYNARGQGAYIPPFFPKTPLPFSGRAREDGERLACWTPANEDSLVAARCDEEGWLVIDRPPEAYRAFLMSREWYHTVEYDLFADEIQGDALARLARMAPPAAQAAP